MAARRSNRKMRRRRRRRLGVLYKLLSAILIVVAVVLGCSVFFRLESVQVICPEQYSQEEVLAAAEIEENSNLFALNKYRIAKRILDSLPYAEEVNIRRQLPDTLIITVSTCQPAAMLEMQDGSWWLISAKGKALEAFPGQPSLPYAVVRNLQVELPAAGSMLEAAEGEESKLENLLSLLTALEDQGLGEQVQEIDMGQLSQITMEYAERFHVEMPANADHARKLRILQAIIDLLEEGEVGTIDMMGEQCYFRAD